MEEEGDRATPAATAHSSPVPPPAPPAASLAALALPPPSLQ